MAASRQKLEIVVRDVETDAIETVLEGATKVIIVGAHRMIVEKDGKNTPYAPDPKQYLVLHADGKDVQAKQPIVVGKEAPKTCSFLVGIQGASFLKQCGELATTGERCEEHQGR